MSTEQLEPDQRGVAIRCRECRDARSAAGTADLYVIAVGLLLVEPETCRHWWLIDVAAAKGSSDGRRDD